MSIMDCMRGQVPKKMFDDINEAYEGFKQAHNNNEMAADAALLEWLPGYRNDTVNAKLNHAMKSMEVEQRVMQMEKEMTDQWAGFTPAQQWLSKKLGFGRSRHEPTRANAVERLYHLADIEATRGSMELIGTLSELYKKAAPKGLSLDADRSIMREVVRGLIDGVDTLDNAEVRAIAKELRESFINAAKAYRQAGGRLGDIKNYVPIKHNARAMQLASKDEWVAAYTEMTDIGQVIDYRTGKNVTKERFKEIAEDMYDDITTNGQTRIAREASKTGTSKRFKNPDMFSRRMQARLSKPKNAAAFKAYNDKFGVGDEGMFDLILSNLESMGRDTGVMRSLGPTPFNVSHQLEKSILQWGGTAREVQTSKALFRTLVGHWDGSVDSIFSRSATNIHNAMSANLLGTASVAALGDRVFANQTKRLYKLVGGKDFEQYIKTLVDGGNEEAILRQIHIYESLSHNSVSRYDGTIGSTPSGWMGTKLNNLKNMNHRISGLQRLTQATGDGLTMGFFGDISSYISDGVKMGDLPKEFSDFLRSIELNEEDWGRLLAHGNGENGFMTPNILPDEMSSIAGKLDRANMQLRMFATNSPDLRQKMWSTGNRLGSQTRGDVGHVMSSLIFQFKSFPMMVYKNHMVPAIMQAAGGNVSPIVMLTLQSFFYGAAIVQLKEAIKGNALYEYDDPAFWAKSYLQTGAAGLFGEFLFKDPDGFGRSWVQDIAGPGIGVTATFAQRSYGALMGAATDADYNVNWASLVNATKPFVPLSTLWYARIAYDRMLGDSLTAALEGPDFYRNAARKEKEMVEERGKPGWYMQGDFMAQDMF